MADALTIQIKGLDQLQAQLRAFGAELEKDLQKILDKHSQAIVTKAKTNAPTDEGILKNSISISQGVQNRLSRHIVVNSPYGGFMEFGTGRYAAEYVAKLPQSWQEYAATFKGQKGSGTFDDLVIIIKQWLIRKKIDVFNHEQQYDHESGFAILRKQRHSQAEKERQLDEVAYLIARKIVRVGVHEQPYLYPAYKDEVQKIKDDVKNLFKK
jgi:HK97 gp10 family phage protein